MQFSGQIFTTNELEQSDQGKIVRVDFDTPGASVNVFNDAVFDELNQVLDLAENDSDLGGLVFTSSKGVFVAGADITILLDHAKHKSLDEFMQFIGYGHQTFNRLQSLPVATAAAINGLALGGGLEFTLAMDTRVMAMEAKVGVPEVALGVFPGWGGTVRLPRMIAPEIAAQWIATGKPQRADLALSEGLVAAITTQDDLLSATISQLKLVQHNFDEIRTKKMQPINMSAASSEAFEELQNKLSRVPGKHYPAASVALQSIQSQAKLGSLAAAEIEIKDFSTIIKTDTAINLLSVFMNEQAAGKAAKTHARGATKVKSAAVIGAGIMGGGIAYQSALRNVPAVMKDINQEALDLGMAEADRNFSTLVKKGRLDEDAKGAALARIKPTLENDDIAEVDAVVEAVVENINVKKSVIADIEGRVNADTVIASNTSTISITRIAEDLQRPDKFCGMHFFNPVPVMPLVEIIRGAKTSDETISKTVGYALQLGKKPVVVNDCPGFLVNRVLFPYINAAHMLINEGVDFQFIDGVMEAWGWPMGPAYLSDVIGIDTMVHCLDVMANDIPERMALEFRSANHIMHGKGRLGQKNGLGFYRYARNELGRMAKQTDDLSQELLYTGEAEVQTPEEVSERLMVAICLETVRCLQEEIVASPAEADMALLWGLGFPKFRGGTIRHIDTVGVEEFCQMSEKYAHLGPLYELPQLLMDKRAAGDSFYG